MRHCCLVDADVEVIAELQERFPCKLGSIVGDDGVGHPKMVDDVAEESGGLRRCELGNWSGLDPFGELIHHHKQVGAAARCFLDGPDQV